MTWFKADDRLSDHRKVRLLGRDRLPAMGLWLLAGTWASGEGTDGFVPAEIVQRWDARERMAARLVDVALWEPVELDGEQGYRFHDWPDWQPSKADEEKKRAGATVRQQKHRGRRRAEHASRNGDGTYASEQPVTQPVTRDVTRDSGVTESVSHAVSHPAPGPASSYYVTTTRPDPARPAGARPREAPSPTAEQAVASAMPAGVGRRDRASLARLCDEASSDGASWTAIERGLLEWRSRSDVSPGFLPSLITNAVKAEHVAAGPRPGTDSKTAGWAAVRDELEQNATVIQLPPGAAS